MQNNRVVLITFTILLILGPCFSQDTATTGTAHRTVFSTDGEGSVAPDARTGLPDTASKATQADGQGASVLDSHAQEHKPSSAQNGAWDFSIWIAGATGEEKTNSFTEAQIRTSGVFVGKVITGEIGHGWRGGNLEYGFNLIPVFATSGNQSVKGGGFEPVVLRWNSANHIGRAVPYIELAGGGVFTTSNLPAGDTSSFNFTAKGGGGVYIFTKERQSLDIGCRWWHISNANLGVRNPEFNGVQVTLGYHWFKSRASSRAQ